MSEVAGMNSHKRRRIFGRRYLDFGQKVFGLRPAEGAFVGRNLRPQTLEGTLDFRLRKVPSSEGISDLRPRTSKGTSDFGLRRRILALEHGSCGSHIFVQECRLELKFDACC